MLTAMSARSTSDIARAEADERTRKSGAGYGYSKVWPTPLPPLAPIGGWTAVVDGTAQGLPDAPLALMQQGKVNKSPTGEKISVIMGTNRDEVTKSKSLCAVCILVGPKQRYICLCLMLSPMYMNMSNAISDIYEYV
jgi:hypothetical protein